MIALELLETIYGAKFELLGIRAAMLDLRTGPEHNRSQTGGYSIAGEGARESLRRLGEIYFSRSYATSKRLREASGVPAMVIRSIAAGLLMAAATAIPAGAEMILTCAGDIWGWNSGGNRGVEIGHGLYQCSLKGPRVTRQIMSVCKDKARCTVMVEIVKPARQGSGPPKSVDASRDVDTLEIHDKDRILIVRAGAEDESGYAASEALRVLKGE